MLSKYRLIKILKKEYYITYKITLKKPIKRQALTEIDGNKKKKKKKGLQSWYAYIGYIKDYYY